MAGYKRTRVLSPPIAAYIAGLVDGEGTIAMSRRHANERRHVVVSIANTELPLLRFVLKQLRTGKITRKRAVSLKHTPSYCYSVSNRQALDLLEQIVLYLRSYKLSRAQLVLKHYRSLTPRNGKYTPEIAKLRDAFERRFHATKAHGNSKEICAK